MLIMISLTERSFLTLKYSIAEKDISDIVVIIVKKIT